MGQVTLSTSEYKELVKAEEIVRQLRENIQFAPVAWDTKKWVVQIYPMPLLEMVREEAAVAQIPLALTSYRLSTPLEWDIVNNEARQNPVKEESTNETAGL